MLSIDTNILFYAQNADCPENAAAITFLEECSIRDDVVICELVLVELYQLLRNQKILTCAYSAKDAVEVCQAFRSNPRWALIENAPVMGKVWALAVEPGTARRRLFDARLAYTLRHHGVTELATRNVKDFGGFGFSEVWNPLSLSG